MKMWQLALLLTGLALPGMTLETKAGEQNGIIDVPSNHSVDETVDRVKNILRTKGITLFAVIDHSGEGGDEDAPTKLLIFENPEGEHLSCWLIPALPST